MFVPMATPFLNHLLLYLDRVILAYSHPAGSHFCRYVHMDNAGSASTDVETWTLVNYLEEGGFPALLGTPWRTLGTPLTQSTRRVRSWPLASSFVVKWRWRFQCARPILLGKSGSVRHKDWTWLTRCRRLLSKHSQLSVGSTQTSSRLCSQSNSCTWATHCTWCRTWSYPSSPEQLWL
jgi:hypothetical protein